jgi:hypothetical protein
MGRTLDNAVLNVGLKGGIDLCHLTVKLRSKQADIFKSETLGDLGFDVCYVPFVKGVQRTPCGL